MALRKRPRLWAGLAVLLAVLVAGGAYGWRRTAPFAEVGGVYIAKQMCSCVFLTGRTEGSCRAEFKPDIDRFTVAVDRPRARVSTSLAVFKAEATYAEGYGCTVAR